MGYRLQIFERLVVLMLLITSTSAGGPKFSDDYTTTLDTIGEISSDGGQILYNRSDYIFSDTSKKLLRVDAEIHELNNGKPITARLFLLINGTDKKSWNILNVEGQPPSKCMESPFDGLLPRPLDFSRLDLMYQGVFPGPNGLMFDTWSSTPVVDNGKTLNLTTVTSLDKMPATFTVYQNTTFISSVFKVYTPTAPDATIFKLPPECNNNTILLKKGYKSEYLESFKYLFPGLQRFRVL